MSSDLYFYDSPDLVFPDPFSPSSEDVFSELSNNKNDQNPVKNSNFDHNFTPNLLSNLPPRHQLESLSLYGGIFSGLDEFGVKTEMGFEKSESCYNNDQNQAFFMPNSVENVAKFMQRSYSSNSFENKTDFLFQPHFFDSLLESPSPNFQGPPESSFLSGQIRRICSTGDLQNVRNSHSTERSYSSPLASESSLMEDGNFKVGRYSAEERKDRISKYRAKRNQRNFSKTIKYACRKTLADNRPRIRGRFARNDEFPKAACSSTRHEDEDELWFDGLHGEEDQAGNGRRGDFVNSYNQAQFQYFSY